MLLLCILELRPCGCRVTDFRLSSLPIRCSGLHGETTTLTLTLTMIPLPTRCDGSYPNGDPRLPNDGYTRDGHPLAPPKDNAKATALPLNAVVRSNEEGVILAKGTDLLPLAYSDCNFNSCACNYI